MQHHWCWWPMWAMKKIKFLPFLSVKKSSSRREWLNGGSRRKVYGHPLKLHIRNMIFQLQRNVSTLEENFKLSSVLSNKNRNFRTSDFTTLDFLTPPYSKLILDLHISHKRLRRSRYGLMRQNCFNNDPVPTKWFKHGWWMLNLKWNVNLDKFNKKRLP